MVDKKIKITLPDDSEKEVKSGITGLEIAGQIGENLKRSAVGIIVNGVPRDLTYPINDSSDIKILTFNDEEGKEIFRHSSAHLMAQAVMKIYPEAKLTIGPVVEEGFYYDIDHPSFKEEDLIRIEDEMKMIVKQDLPIVRKEITKAEALKIFKGNEYKVEIINNIDEFGEGKTESDKLSVYEQGKFIDLCRGPHLPRTGMIKAFKLTKLAGAYWRGDAKNKQLQRIYGISFPDKKQLKEYLEMLEEAERRNHKTIGESMELFTHFDLIGKGLPVLLPKGETIRREIEKFAIETEDKYGYVRVATPHLAKKELFEKSGHLPFYKDSMYPSMEMDDGTYLLKAMNCPLHHLIFSKKPRSYKELPMRIAEYGTVYRNELSGTLNGLLRVRILRMNDAHIYCTKEQIDQEIEKTLEMTKNYFEVFGFKDYWFRLSLGNTEKKEKYVDEPENWEYAENVLRNCLVRLKMNFLEEKDEAAFYGPKIDVQFKNVYGREETMSTIQLDFAAKTRFNLVYDDKEGKRSNEVFVIHRAPLSTHERLIAFLIENFAGRFPLWLSPVQVKILTITDRNDLFADRVAENLILEGIRVEKDYRAETLNRKIRDAQIEQANYIVVIGDKEAEGEKVNVRTREGKIIGVQSIDEFKEMLVKEIKFKKK